jgi:hypothetical protein
VALTAVDRTAVGPTAAVSTGLETKVSATNSSNSSHKDISREALDATDIRIPTKAAQHWSRCGVCERTAEIIKIDCRRTGLLRK